VRLCAERIPAMAKGHMRGGKISGSHSTVIDAAQKVVKLAERLPEVTKVSLGYIKNGLPTGGHHIKCAPIVGGLRVDVRGTHSKQEVFVYTNDLLKTTKALEALFA